MVTDKPAAMRSTEGMVDYDKNSDVQLQLIEAHSELTRSLTERVGLVTPEFRIVDYGCGPGTTAIEAVRPAIETYRARYPEGPIAVCHADQPGNDWNALFQLASGPSGYLAGSEAVRTEAAIGSFYDQLLSANSVALGTSYMATHWLQHGGRLHSPGTVWFADLTGKARTEMAAIARRDWVQFLRCRALELRPGGYLLVSKLGAVPDESEANRAAASGRGIYRALQVVAQGMADDRLLSQEVLDWFLFGLWFMTAEEARAPIESDSVLGQAFEIEDISVRPAPVNPADVFIESIDNPVEYARRYVGYTRAFADSTIRKQLLEPSTTGEANTNHLGQEFYDRLEKLYRVKPGKYACEIWYLTVVLRRR